MGASESSAALHSRRIRWGAAALVVSGVSFAIAAFLVVDTFTPPDETRVVTVASAVNANSTAWRVGMAVTFVAYATLVFGSFALYAALARTNAERWALAGLLTTVGAVVFYVPLLGVVAFVAPAVGALVESGNADAITVLDRTWTEPFIFLPFVAGMLQHVGVALLGVAVWRADVLTRWSGAVLVLAGILGLPAFLDVEALEWVAPLTLAAGLVFTGVSLWRSAGREEGDS